MSEGPTSWIRHRPDRAQNRLALGAGLAVGMVVGGAVFYLTKLFIAREAIGPVAARDMAVREHGEEREAR